MTAPHFSQQHGDHPEPHSFPTRRSSDLRVFRALASRRFAPSRRAPPRSASSSVLPERSARSSTASRRSEPLRSRSEEHTLNSSHSQISYAVFCLKKKKRKNPTCPTV